MASDPAKLVTYLVNALVDDPEQVSIEEKRDGDDLLFEVQVAPDDIGKLIGRQGRIVKAIRTLARAAGVASPGHVDVEILG